MCILTYILYRLFRWANQCDIGCALSHKTPGKEPESKQWVKGATKSPLLSISGNRLVQRRCEKEDESKLRTWRKDAMKMAADLAA